MQVIQRDGMEWPLETFIDAYAFTRIDRLRLMPMGPELMDAILDDGSLLEGEEAGMLPWPQVVAVKPKWLDQALDCVSCGMLVHAGEFDFTLGKRGHWCELCNEEATWDDFDY